MVETTKVSTRPIIRPILTRPQKAKEFVCGFVSGATSPVSAWAHVRSVVLQPKGQSIREFGRNLGYLAISSATLGFAVAAASCFPEIREYVASLADRDWTLWAKSEILRSTTPAEVFRSLSPASILRENIPTGKYINYFLPYLAAVPIGAANEFAREASQKEQISPLKIGYVSLRFLLGTMLLVKLSEWTWGMPYIKALAHEVVAWGLYYGAFTIPTAFARGKKPREIDNILRKQVFYASILTSIGLAALTAFVNPVVLRLLGPFGSLDKFGHIAPILTRGAWETFTTQMVLRAEFGGDEFISRALARVKKRDI